MRSPSISIFNLQCRMEGMRQPYQMYLSNLRIWQVGDLVTPYLSCFGTQTNWRLVKQVCLTLGWSSVVFALCLLIEKNSLYRVFLLCYFLRFWSKYKGTSDLYSTALEICYMIGTRILEIDLEIAEIIEVKVGTRHSEIDILLLHRVKKIILVLQVPTSTSII